MSILKSSLPLLNLGQKQLEFWRRRRQSEDSDKWVLDPTTSNWVVSIPKKTGDLWVARRQRALSTGGHGETRLIAYHSSTQAALGEIF